MRRVLIALLALSLITIGWTAWAGDKVAAPKAAKPDAPEAAAAPATDCIDVETASAKDLEQLKGVGPELAKRIIDYRKVERTKATKEGRETWNFRNWATLMKVKGVGPQICTDNINAVCFSGEKQKACPKAEKAAVKK